MIRQKTLARKFLDRFIYIDDDFKLKLSASEVREFLKEQEEEITFNKFNKLVYCEGRTTGNKYVYDLLGFYNEARTKVGMCRDREFSKTAIKTLNYYGTKRRWREEYELLYHYVYGLGCHNVIDVCAGSGFLSLLASRTGLFKKIILNELSNTVFNYHLVQKQKQSFDKFICYLERFGEVDESLYLLLKEDLAFNQQREERKHVRSADVTKATELFIVTHYAHSGQGDYIEDRKAPYEYVDALKKTHRLYQSIQLSHYHYHKITKNNMNNADCLILIDTPYLAETRVQKKSYNLEFSTRQHRYLLELLTEKPVNAKIILCGYHSQMYENYFLRYNEKHDTHWHEVKLLRPGSKKADAEAKEIIWVNFEIESLVNQHKDLFKIVW